MARRDQELFPDWADVNLLLFTAWEHGARHAALTPEGDGTEIRFLGPDGAEHIERLSLPFAATAKQLCQMSGRFGRMHLEMGGHEWHLEVVSPTRRPDRIFLHMHPVE